MKNFKDNSKIRFNKISTEKCFMFNGARIWRGIEHIKSVSVYETEVFIIELLPGQVLENVTTVHDDTAVLAHTLLLGHERRADEG